MNICLFTIFCVVFFESSRHHRDLHSFPTRRTSDLVSPLPEAQPGPGGPQRKDLSTPPGRATTGRSRQILDRKSTRLNSSHPSISYAVLRLKQKKYINTPNSLPQDKFCWNEHA